MVATQSRHHHRSNTSLGAIHQEQPSLEDKAHIAVQRDDRDRVAPPLIPIATRPSRQSPSTLQRNLSTPSAAPASEPTTTSAFDDLESPLQAPDAVEHWQEATRISEEQVEPYGSATSSALSLTDRNWAWLMTSVGQGPLEATGHPSWSHPSESGWTTPLSESTLTSGYMQHYAALEHNKFVCGFEKKLI